MSKIANRLMWAVVGTAASKLARGTVRRKLHTAMGAPKLPRGVRRKTGLGTALAWAVGTGVAMGLADLLSEQGQTAARARDPKPA